MRTYTFRYHTDDRTADTIDMKALDEATARDLASETIDGQWGFGGWDGQLELLYVNR